MNTKDILRQAEKFSANNYKPLPVVISRGLGVWVWDADGKKYLDCLAAYSAINQGHCHPKIVQALVEQAQKLTMTSRAFHNEVMGELLETLCRLSEMEMALPMNTGAEGVETALKAARKWGYTKKGILKDRAEIIVCRNNFHGRTTTIVGFSSEPQYRENFGPYGAGFKIIDFGNIEQLKQAINENTAAFLVEPIQGEAGILIPPSGYLSEVRKLCTQKQILMILDEIQTGFGRTGKLFAYHYELEAKPDVLIVGKALAGGLYPVSAVLSSRDVLGVFEPGDHGSTFGGNPLGSAVALAAIKVTLEENLAQRSFEMGQYFMQRLREIRSPHIQEFRGRGLMIAVEIQKSSGPARPLCEKLMTLGVLAKETHGQVIRLTPPLIIQKEEIDFVVDALMKVL